MLVMPNLFSLNIETFFDHLVLNIFQKLHMASEVWYQKTAFNRFVLFYVKTMFCILLTDHLKSDSSSTEKVHWGENKME